MMATCVYLYIGVLVAVYMRTCNLIKNSMQQMSLNKLILSSCWNLINCYYDQEIQCTLYSSMKLRPEGFHDLHVR